MLERRELGRGIVALVSRPLESAGFLVAFTERSGGTSAAPYRSLNLSLATDDAPESVRENRRRACDALSIERFATGEQVHGARIGRVGPKRAGAGFEDRSDSVAGTDALLTTSRGVAIGVLVADCVPIALADPQSGRLCVVHAGWREIAAGVVSTAIGAFPDPTSVRAAIGPAIGPDHYEVGQDVALAVSAASAGGAVVARRGNRIFLDLPGTVARILKERGVRRIEDAGLCTACETRRFFSHRRDGVTGRQALLALRLA